MILTYSRRHPPLSSSALLELLRRAELDLVACVEPPGLVESLVTTPLTSEPPFVPAPDRRALDRPPREWGPWVTFPTGAHTRLVIQHQAVAGERR